VDVGQPGQPLGCGGEHQRSHRGIQAGIRDVQQAGGLGGVDDRRRRDSVAVEGGAQRPLHLLLVGFAVVVDVDLAHLVRSSLRRLSPSWTLRRAAGSEISIVVAISAYAESAMKRRATAVRCLSGSAATAVHSSWSGMAATPSAAGASGRSAGSATGV